MLNDADARFSEALKKAVPGLSVSEATPDYLEEPRRLYFGRPGFVARPRTTEDVAAIVSACAKAHVGLVPYGGGTGLVSGQISTSGPVPLVVSL